MIPNFVRQFIRRIIKNPIQAGIVAYLVWQVLKKHVKKESFSFNNEGDLVVETVLSVKEMSEPNNSSLWQKAVAAFSRSHGREPVTDNDYAVVTGLYSKMGGGFKERDVVMEKLQRLKQVVSKEVAEAPCWDDSVSKEELKVNTEYKFKLVNNNVDFEEVGDILLVDESDSNRLYGLGIPFEEAVSNTEQSYKERPGFYDIFTRDFWDGLTRVMEAIEISGESLGILRELKGHLIGTMYIAKRYDNNFVINKLKEALEELDSGDSYGEELLVELINDVKRGKFKVYL